MDNLLFYTLLIAIAYYSLVHLPAQKSHSLSPYPLTHSKNTQTEPIITKSEPEAISDPTIVPKLTAKITALTQELKTKEKTTQEHQTKIRELQAQIRDLTKKPVTSAKSTQTSESELTKSLDKLIQEIQELNNTLC
jgi:hypothetical protein